MATGFPASTPNNRPCTTRVSASAPVMPIATRWKPASRVHRPSVPDHRDVSGQYFLQAGQAREEAVPRTDRPIAAPVLEELIARSSHASFGASIASGATVKFTLADRIGYAAAIRRDDGDGAHPHFEPRQADGIGKADVRGPDGLGTNIGAIDSIGRIPLQYSVDENLNATDGCTGDGRYCRGPWQPVVKEAYVPTPDRRGSATLELTDVIDCASLCNRVLLSRARRCFQRFHRNEVRARAVAHPRDTMLCQDGHRGCGIANHDVEREQ